MVKLAQIRAIRSRLFNRPKKAFGNFFKKSGGKNSKYKKLVKILFVASLSTTLIGGIMVYYHEPTRHTLIAITSTVRTKFIKTFDKGSSSLVEQESSDNLDHDWSWAKPTVVFIGVIMLLIQVTKDGEFSGSVELDRELPSSPTFWKDCWDFYLYYRPFLGCVTTYVGVGITPINPVLAVILQILGWQMGTFKR